MAKDYINNNIIVVIDLGESFYEFVSLLKPYGISFELVNEAGIVLARRKRVYSRKFVHIGRVTFVGISKEYQCCLGSTTDSVMDKGRGVCVDGLLIRDHSRFK